MHLHCTRQNGNSYDLERISYSYQIGMNKTNANKLALARLCGHRQECTLLVEVKIGVTIPGGSLKTAKVFNLRIL